MATPEYNEQTNIFALGTAFYHIVAGYKPFPELDSFTREEEIEERFISSQFPATQLALTTVIMRKCWRRDYNSAHEIINGLGLCKLNEAFSIEG